MHVSLLAFDLVGDGCGSRPHEPALLLLAAEARRLRATATDTGWHKPAHAMAALARIAPDTATRLLQIYARHASWFVRMYAARAAASVKDRATLRRLAGDVNDNVREAAVVGLTAVEGHDADSVYLAQLVRKDYQLLRATAAALENTPDSNAAPAILAALRRVSAEKRETARDARRALLDRWARVARREQVEPVLRGYLADYDTLIARQAADLMSTQFGVTRRPLPSPLPRAPAPSPAELTALEGAQAVITMRSGGVLVLRLRPLDAPTNVARFARLARVGYFNGLTFHRIAPNFVVQGGSPGANEYWGDGPYSRDELTLAPHLRGTVGISTRGRDTGDGQIFVNLIDNWRLDHNYTIIGEVVAGMDVVDRMLEGAVIERIELR
jgi:cyclophilin family peptidyl-prolyl cis-trans isomerase